jgi:hypothetical protein
LCKQFLKAIVTLRASRFLLGAGKSLFLSNYKEKGEIKMNFDTKYLIRWGIPGWVFILFVGTPIIYYEFDEFTKLKLKLTDTLGLLVSLGFFGVTIGYLMHQIYFSFNWTWFSNRRRIIDEAIKLIEKKEEIIDTHWMENYHRDYYKFEYLWHKQLLKLDQDRRNYITDRYRHLLSTVHSLGALRVSLTISFIYDLILITYKWIIVGSKSLILVIYLVMIACLIYCTCKGFKYYSSNLNYFQGYFFNSLLNGEFGKEDNNE